MVNKGSGHKGIQHQRAAPGLSSSTGGSYGPGGKRPVLGRRGRGNAGVVQAETDGVSVSESSGHLRERAIGNVLSLEGSMVGQP